MLKSLKKSVMNVTYHHSSISTILPHRNIISIHAYNQSSNNLPNLSTLSTVEAKYVVVTEVAKEMIWLQFFMEELGHP